MNVGPPANQPESSDNDSGAIADRVTVLGDRALLLREIPVQSPASVNIMFDRLETLTQEWPRFSYVVDLTEAGRPGPETRAALKQRVVRVRPRIESLLDREISFRERANTGTDTISARDLQREVMSETPPPGAEDVARTPAPTAELAIDDIACPVHQQ